jgi:hypothetical protein
MIPALAGVRLLFCNMAAATARTTAQFDDEIGQVIREASGPHQRRLGALWDGPPDVGGDPP